MVALFLGKKNPTYIQWVSIFTSFFMVVVTLSKTLMPQKFSRKQSLAEKAKNIVWAICISFMLMLVLILNLTFMAGSVINQIHFLSPAQQKMCFIIGGTQNAILILTYLSMYLFCAKRLKKINRKCLNISIFVLLNTLGGCISWSTVLLNASPHGSGGVVMYTMLLIFNFFIAFVFAKAAFIVRCVREIWSLDVMTKKQLCPIPNMLLSTAVLLNVAGFASVFLSNNSIFYN